MSKPRGRKITLHLVDGTANGIIKAQIGNWVGQVTFGKLTQLEELASDEEIKRPGVYILSGPDPAAHHSESVYIGESENVWKRLKEHNKDDTKTDFERITIITSKDENLTKSHIRYLESKLILIAHEYDRSTVNNGTKPDIPHLPLADRDEMDEFLDHIKLLLPVLGLEFVLEPPDTGVDSPVFGLVTKSQATGIEVTARAKIISKEFVVLKGSTALLRRDGSYASQKEQLIRNGQLVEENSIYRFAEDVPFNSPSAAAAVIRGQNTNGRVFWKLNETTTYGDWLDARIAERERTQL